GPTSWTSSTACSSACARARTASDAGRASGATSSPITAASSARPRARSSGSASRATPTTRARAAPRSSAPRASSRAEARVRVVAWNIRAGGGVRAAGIARQLARWQPAVVALSEFRATPPTARRWRLGPALPIGDTNSGRRGLDEEVPVFSAREEGWIDALAGCGWADAFRHLRAEARAYTWYSPNGRNGFRIDQAFVNAPLLARLKDAAYVWGGAASRARRDRLSDHAALLVDLAEV